MPDPGPPEFDSRIVPGKRIGPIALGASGPALEKTLGPPERSSPSTSGSGKTWRGVTADISDDTQRVMSVYTEDATYTTDGGVHSGSSEEALRGALGAPTTVSRNTVGTVANYCYDSGITFTVGGGRVLYLVVRPRGPCH